LAKTTAGLRRPGHPTGGIKTMKAFHLIFAANLSEQLGPPLISFAKVSENEMK